MIEADHTPPKRGLNMTTVLLIAGLALLGLMIGYFTTNRNSDQDKLTDTQVTSSGAPASNLQKSCAIKPTYDLIKRELFRGAAQRRGSDAAAYDKLAAYAVLRMENPVMESADEAARTVQCSGSLSLDLPPGVAVEGGRRTLMSDVDYSVQPAADGTGNVVLLRNAEAIIAPLATLSRAAAPPAASVVVPPPTVDSLGQPLGNVPPGAAAPPPPAPARPPQAQAAAPPPPRVVAHPSFDCAKARTRGEIAVCSDAGLASLDRQMAGQFNRAIGEADPEQRFLLLRTRAEFLQFRDNCHGDACIANAYGGRMREISDIMSGRLRPR